MNFLYIFYDKGSTKERKRICILVIRCKILDAITEFLSFISGGLKKPPPKPCTDGILKLLSQKEQSITRSIIKVKFANSK